MRARLAGLAAALVLLGALLGLRPEPQPAAAVPPALRLPWAVCGGTVHQLDVVVAGKLRLHRDLLSAGDPDPAQLREAVGLQIQHAFGARHNDPSARGVLTPDGPPHTLEILGRVDVPYGEDMTIEWPADPTLRVESDYVRRALARGRVAAADPAIEFSWRAQVRLIRCDPSADAPQAFELPIPLDPYLLYWTIAASEHVEHVYLARRTRSFPCADPQIADYPHPEYLWYFWRPTDCAAPQRGLGRASLQLTRQAVRDGDLSAWRGGLAAAIADRPLRIVVVFGYLNHQVPRPSPAEVHAALTTPGALPRGVDAEWGSAQYVEFVRRLDELLEHQTRRLFTQDSGPVAELRGNLRGSGRPIELAVHLTETDYLAPPAFAPRHRPLLLAALREADAILYAGHSGLGQNFSLAQLAQGDAQGEVAAALQRSPVRLLGFIGCYTYSYFGDDLAERLPRSAGDPGTLLVYSGNAVVHTADSVVHVLRTLDCLLASADGVIGPGICDLPPPGPKDSPDFLVYGLAP